MPQPFYDLSCSSCKTPCIFFNMKYQDKSDVHSLKRDITFKKGETIFKQGTFISKIIYIREGLVKQVYEGMRDKDLIIRFIGHDSYIGITNLFGKNEARFTVEALCTSRICMLESNYFRKHLLQDRSLYEQVIKLYNNDQDFLYERLGIIGTRNLQGRLAQSIIYLNDLAKAVPEIFKYITRKELAELSAMSVESMIRLLNEFKHDKLIIMKGKHIEINNADILKVLSRVG